MFSSLFQDLRFSFRLLAKTPGFTALAISVLALGIGMNTAMFSVIKAVLFSALPYPKPDQLVQLWQTAKDGHAMHVSWLDFKDWRAQNRSIADMATFGSAPVSLAGDFTPRRIRTGVVSTAFFATIGTQALIGRTFTPGDQTPGAAATAVIGYSLASALYGRPASAIGKTLRMDGLSFSVIGVMPPRFDFPDHAQVWIPSELFPDKSQRSAHNYEVLGRLKPGVSLRRAQADMDIVAARLARTYVDDRDEGIRLVPLYDQLTAPVRPALLVLLGAVIFVLLIACLNISNLQLSRALARMKEFALRSSLGAGRGRLIRQLLTEGVLLSVAGGVAGLLLATALTGFLRHAAPQNIPRIQDVRVDTGVLLFTSALSICAGVLFGILPAVAGSRTNLAQPLKSQSGASTAAPALKRWAKALVMGQTALSIVLLAGAAMLMKSYWLLARVNPGLNPSGVFVTNLSWSTEDGNFANAAKVAAMSRRLLAGIGSLPRVRAVALTNTLPVRDRGADGNFEIKGRPLPADPHQAPDAWYRLVTRDYFHVFGIPILKGRAFTPQDDQSAAQVAIVNQTFANEFFPREDPIGRQIRFFGFDRKPQFMTIVGIVPDMRALGLSRPAAPEVFADYLQHAGSVWVDSTLVVRGPSDDEPAVKRLIGAVDPDTPVEFHGMEEVIGATITSQRFQTSLLSIFAGFALLLAVIGIYGLLSYTVARRTSEIGIRMALGADRPRVLTLVLREGGVLVAGGLALGLIAAVFLTRTLTTLLFLVRAADPLSLIAVALLFAAIAMIGCYLPAKRAAGIDPNVALRYE
jgi:predicted permease